jgi:hypothetical protein
MENTKKLYKNKKTTWHANLISKKNKIGLKKKSSQKKAKKN